MSGNAVAKVFDIECPLEARCEEAPEWSDKRCEEGQKEEMELIWSIRNGRKGSSQLEVGGQKLIKEDRMDVHTTADMSLLTGAQICHSFQMNTGFGVH